MFVLFGHYSESLAHFVSEAWHHFYPDRFYNVHFTIHLFLCHTVQFIVKNSVEERMVAIQRKKQDLVEKAFGARNSDRKTSRIEDIKALMEL